MRGFFSIFSIVAETGHQYLNLQISFVFEGQLKQAFKADTNLFYPTVPELYKCLFFIFFYKNACK